MGGVFTDWIGWRATFALLGVLFAWVAVVLFAGTRRHRPAPARGAFSPVAGYARLLARPAVRRLAACGFVETFFYFGAFAFLGAWLHERFALSFTLRPRWRRMRAARRRRSTPRAGRSARRSAWRRWVSPPQRSAWRR